MKQKVMHLVKSLSSFAYLNMTQFLGAMNDNIYKLLIIYFFIQIEGIENSHIVLSTTGAIYVMPFLLFSSSAGILADRFSKRNIIITTKLLETMSVILGLLSFYYSSMLGAYCTLFLLATHSALFSPSKYGILPELLPQEKISQANGLMTSFTYLAVILGTFLASFMLDVTGRNFIIAASFCIAIALVGVCSSLFIQHTPPSGSHRKFNLHFVYEIYKTLKLVKHEPSLLAAMLGSAFFLFLGAYVQLNMIPFAVQSLHLTDVQGGYLFLLTAIGIGSGSLISGKISGKKVELAIVPLAALGITACFFSLDLLSPNLFYIIPLVILTGIFGGMYLIPLDSYIQIASPKQHIGQAVAATTFLSFVGVLLASATLYIVTELFGLRANEGFIIMGCLTTVLTLVYSYLFFDYLTRFIGMILSRLHFKITFEGQANIPDVPAIYICAHTAWNDTLLLLGLQRRRMRFFVEREHEHTMWLKRLYRMLQVVIIPEIETLEHSPRCLSAIKKSLDRGISVCIFIESHNVDRELEKLKHAHLVKEILKSSHCPLITVEIEKGEKDQNLPRFITKLMHKIRVPATVTLHSVPWEEPETSKLSRNLGSKQKKTNRVRGNSATTSSIFFKEKLKPEECQQF